MITAKKFQKIVFDYFRNHGRRLPWRETIDSYAIFVSEVMLQQTQVDRVVSKYQAWLKKFPTWRSLAKASAGEVLRMWQGLGYNRRALNLRRAAERIMQEYGGELSDDVELLKKLPGVGPYTAGAVLAFAFNKPVPIIETNIRRVYIHHFFPEKKKVSDSEILKLVTSHLPLITSPRTWYYALMDYGSHMSKIVSNPNRKSKHYAKQLKFKGSRRQIRGAILRLLAQNGSTTKQKIKTEFNGTSHNIEEILKELETEGFLRIKKSKIIIQ